MASSMATPVLADMQKAKSLPSTDTSGSLVRFSPIYIVPSWSGSVLMAVPLFIRGVLTFPSTITGA